MNSILPFERNDNITPANIHQWLDALPLTNEQRATYGYFIYIPATHRVLLFERDSDSPFSYWCLKSHRLLHTFDFGTSEYINSFVSASGNWLVSMIETDSGNAQSMTVYLKYIGEGFELREHLDVLVLFSFISTTFEVGFDASDNLWVDGMQSDLPNGKLEFGMEYYALSFNNGEPNAEKVHPCPYERMDTEGFERYQIEPSPIALNDSNEIIS